MNTDKKAEVITAMNYDSIEGISKMQSKRLEVKSFSGVGGLRPAPVATTSNTHPIQSSAQKNLNQVQTKDNSKTK